MNGARALLPVAHGARALLPVAIFRALAICAALVALAAPLFADGYIDLAPSSTTLAHGDKLTLISNFTRPAQDAATIWRWQVPPQLTVLGVTATIRIINIAQLNCQDAAGNWRTIYSNPCEIYLLDVVIGSRPDTSGALRIDLGRTLNIPPGATGALSVEVQYP